MRSIIRILGITLVFVSPSLPLFGQGVSPIGCSQPLKEPVEYIKLAGNPGFPVATRNGCYVFVRMESPGGKPGIEVLHRGNGRLEHFLVVPIGGTPFLTPDEKLLIIRDDSRVYFADTQKLLSGEKDFMLGSAGDQHFGQPGLMAATSDSRYLFIRQNATAWITAIDLGKVRAGLFDEAIVGGVPTIGEGGPALILSRDDRHLYVANKRSDLPITCRSFNRPTATLEVTDNDMTVMDVRKVISSSSDAVISEVRSGCHGGPNAVSPDGNTVYVLQMVDDLLIAFDVRPVQTGQPPVEIGRVPVGAAPRGVAVVDGGKKIIVSNSNQYLGGPNDRSYLSVIDAEKIASGAAAIIGKIPAGADPRNMFVTADGRTLLLSNFKSKTLEVVDLDRLKLIMDSVK